ncbi:MAG TPA: hypothetical protein VHJ38_03835, partial [Nitrososphaeraceae archaeon]|nr:hypothetical protein [Nitrososphaeraceae archaeon]
IFDHEIIEKLSKKDKTKIIVKELISNQIQSNGGYSKENEAENKVDQEDYSNINACEGVKGVNTPSKEVSQIIDVEQDTIEIQNSLLELKDSNSGSNNNSNDYQNHQNQIIDSLVLVNGNHKKEQNSSTPFSNAFTVLTPSHSIEEFNNPLISVSDLDIGYDYQPEIISNIDRFEGTDRWFCKNCNIKGDKWFMMKHPCNNNNNDK